MTSPQQSAETLPVGVESFMSGMNTRDTDAILQDRSLQDIAAEEKS